MNISYEEQIECIVLEKIRSKFNEFVKNEFNGSIRDFVNRFIATNSGLFGDIITYGDRFSESLSTRKFNAYLMNISLDYEFKPVFEIIFHMNYTESFLENLESQPLDFELIFDIKRDGKEIWSIEKHVDYDASLSGVISEKDFFLLKKNIEDSKIY